MNKYEYISNAREDIYGIKVDFFLTHGSNFWLNECVHPDDKQYARSALEKKSKESTINEFRIIRPNGELRWIKKEISYINFRDSHCSMMIEEDITETKKQEEVKELLYIYINLLNKGVVIFDFKTRQYLYVNETIEKIYERKAEDFYKGGEAFWLKECLHPEDRGEIGELKMNISDVIKYYESKPINKYRIITKTGQVKFISSENSAVLFKGSRYTLHVQTEIKENNKA